MSVAQSCCTKSPIDSNHIPEGEHTVVGGIKVYSVGPKDSKLAVAFVYDIFGEHPNTMRTVDELSKRLNARVVVPDFFDGKPFPIEKFPVKDIQELLTYLDVHASWSKCQTYLTKVYEGLKAEGHQHVGSLGLCWGAKVCMLVANTPAFTAGHALIHPSFLKAEDAKDVQAPVLVIPSKDEADFLPFMETLQQSNAEVAKKSEHHRFQDMSHGFVGARGDWNNAEIRVRIEEALAITKKFYEHNI